MSYYTSRGLPLPASAPHLRTAEQVAHDESLALAREEREIKIETDRILSDILFHKNREAENKARVQKERAWEAKMRSAASGETTGGPPFLTYPSHPSAPLPTPAYLSDPHPMIAQSGTREERELKREEAERLADIQYHIEREARNKERMRQNLEFEQGHNPHGLAYNPRFGNF
jgi:hypothetical protein